MDLIAPRLIEILPIYGAWLLFLIAVMETCFLTGLVVPSGLATSIGTVLALDGALHLPMVVLAAVTGGVVGDTLGYWIGRFMGSRATSGEGRWARILGRRHATLDRFFGRHPVYSVSVARLVSFVRTVMPMAAGISRIRYPRFLAYDLLGILGWAVLYVGIGVLARESWEVATQVVGVGGAVVFFGLGAFFWMGLRRRKKRRKRDGAGG